MATEPGSSPRRTSAYRAAPPQTHSDAAPEGAEIIREVPGPAGVLLAGGLRDLMLWIESGEAGRGAAFGPDAPVRRRELLRRSELEQPLWMPVLTFALVAEEGSVTVARLLDACRRVAHWAEEGGRPGTRLAFTQAAALLRPGDAPLAIEVAKLARELGQHGRAESWFRHAVRLTRNVDWESYVWAYVGLGVLYIRTGNLPAAGAVMLRALRTSLRRRLAPLAGVAHHHLFHLTTEAGRIRDAYGHVRAALECYGPDHPRLPVLVWDVGRFWLHIGRCERAIPLFETVLDTLSDANDRAVVSANATWAAAGAGDRARYAVFRERTLALVERAVGGQRIDEAFAALAYADLAMGEWALAAGAADEALARAAGTGNNEVRLRAALLRDHAREGSAVAAAAVPVREPAGEWRHGETLAEELVGRLVPA